MAQEDDATISIPSIIFVSFLAFFLYRYFTRPSSSTTSPTSRNRFTAQQVEQVTAMFPQLPRRDIMWDLHRNGGSVPATTERLLAGRTLDRAPANWDPGMVFPSTSSSGSSSGATRQGQKKKEELDLITRYNLQSKIKGKQKAEPELAASSGWSASKEDRAASLKRRREEMILEARRKMQEKDAQGEGDKGEEGEAVR